MSMNVLDLSNYQASLNLDGINYDGVAIKATEGTGYVNPSCDFHYQQAKAKGKKRAIYHFYDFGIDPAAQANYFVGNCLGYRNDAIFVLDWEGSGVADVQQALTCLRQIEARIGYKPAIYMSEWVENAYDWSPVVNENFGLWIAKYSNWELANHAHDWDMSNAGTPPTVKHWPFYFMWQWTSTGYLSGYAGDLDCDIALISQDAWDKYAGVQPPTPPAPATTTTTTVPPTTTTTTTEASPPAPIPTTTTTTTQAPAGPSDGGTGAETSTTTTTTEPQTVTTTTTVTEARQASWLTVLWAAIIAIIERLQGKSR